MLDLNDALRRFQEPKEAFKRMPKELSKKGADHLKTLEKLPLRVSSPQRLISCAGQLGCTASGSRICLLLPQVQADVHLVCSRHLDHQVKEHIPFGIKNDVLQGQHH